MSVSTNGSAVRTAVVRVFIDPACDCTLGTRVEPELGDIRSHPSLPVRLVGLPGANCADPCSPWAN